MELLKQIKSVRKFDKLYQIPFNTINKDFDFSKDTKSIRICVLNNSCYGQGDNVFALKISNYIKEWYNIDVVILASQPKYFLQNGIKLENLYGIKVPGEKTRECADTKDMKIYKVNKDGKFLRQTTIKYQFDLIAFCPWIATDFAPKHSTIKKLFSYANRFNSLLFSTYNSPNPELFDFPTGIGKKYLGVLLTDTNKNIMPRNNKLLPYPYVMVHISYYHSVDTTGCYSSFVKLICKKYHEKNHRLDIVTPTVVLDDLDKLEKLAKYIIKMGYYDRVEIITKKDIEKKWASNLRVLRIRCEVLPLPYKEYTSLFNYCLPDVLLTGNQSVTDIISCCKDYNIYYQIMPWEYSFATNLNNTLQVPGNYLRKYKTACGYEKMDIKMQSNLRRVQQKYDFRVLGKEKLDRIISNIKSITEDPDTIKFVKIATSTRTKTTVIEKFKKYIKMK